MAPANELQERLGVAVSRRLAELGVPRPQVAVERRDELQRSVGGKLEMVVAERVAQAA
jgi:hypothetical protein